MWTTFLNVGILLFDIPINSSQVCEKAKYWLFLPLQSAYMSSKWCWTPVWIAMVLNGLHLHRLVWTFTIVLCPEDSFSNDKTSFLLQRTWREMKRDMTLIDDLRNINTNPTILHTSQKTRIDTNLHPSILLHPNIHPNTHPPNTHPPNTHPPNTRPPNTHLPNTHHHPLSTLHPRNDATAVETMAEIRKRESIRSRKGVSFDNGLKDKKVN